MTGRVFLCLDLRARLLAAQLGRFPYVDAPELGCSIGCGRCKSLARLVFVRSVRPEKRHGMKRLLRKGWNLAEVIGIFAMLGVLCGAIMPHLMKVREASQVSRLRFNLQKLRKQIEDYQNRTGQPPVSLEKAIESEELPENPMSTSSEGFRNHVRRIDVDPPKPRHVTTAGRGGWLYNPITGGVWPDHVRFLTE